jgi:predicted transposase/invertase (TIGR01784 family)
MARYLDPKADVVFKKIFGDHPHLLKSFLNAVLPLPLECRIAELEYLPNKPIPRLPAFKRTAANIKCKDIYGHGFMVEMQIDWTDSFQRLLFGASQAVVKQLENGEAYNLLQPVYGLGIVADVFDKKSTDWYHHYKLAKSNNPDSNASHHLQLIFIELPKFTVQPTDKKDLKVLWLRFLREIDDKTVIVPQEFMDVPEIAEAVSIAQSTDYTIGELNAYEAYWEAVKIERAYASGTFDEGRAIGEAIGEARGKVEGKMEMAEAMLMQGIPLEVVANVSVAATRNSGKISKSKKKTTDSTTKEKTPRGTNKTKLPEK